MTVVKILRLPARDRVSPESLDETDRPPSDYSVPLYEVIGVWFSIVFHFIDIGFDVNVGYRYFYNAEYLYAGLTIFFIFIPSLVNTALSIHMHNQDDSMDIKIDSWSGRATRMKSLWIFIFIFQLAPILRYFDSYCYAVKCRKAEQEKDNRNQKKYYDLMVKEDSDVALLRVIECFLEAAPQQMLQITILLVVRGSNLTTISFIHQLTSIASSFASMAWSIASYHRNIRFAQKAKENISWKGTSVQFMWHILVTVSRILSISVLLSVYPVITCAGLAVHWVTMTIWLNIRGESLFCDRNSLYEFLFYGLFGLVYSFTYISLYDGKTKFKYIFYYTICAIENIAAALIWYLTAKDVLKQTIYYHPLIFLCIMPFILGILFMIIYYKFFHPSTSISSRNSKNIGLTDIATEKT